MKLSAWIAAFFFASQITGSDDCALNSSSVRAPAVIVEEIQREARSFFTSRDDSPWLKKERFALLLTELNVFDAKAIFESFGLYDEPPAGKQKTASDANVAGLKLFRDSEIEPVHKLISNVITQIQESGLLKVLLWDYYMSPNCYPMNPNCYPLRSLFGQDYSDGCVVKCAICYSMNLLPNEIISEIHSEMINVHDLVNGTGYYSVLDDISLRNVQSFYHHSILTKYLDGEFHESSIKYNEQSLVKCQEIVRKVYNLVPKILKIVTAGRFPTIRLEPIDQVFPGGKIAFLGYIVIHKYNIDLDTFFHRGSTYVQLLEYLHANNCDADTIKRFKVDYEKKFKRDCTY